jgi:hypothetical protein
MAREYGEVTGSNLSVLTGGSRETGEGEGRGVIVDSEHPLKNIRLAPSTLRS